MEEISQKFTHWSSYWLSGALTSLPEDFRANYDGEVAGFWKSRFAKLGRSANILDVCCGNGPISLLAANWAESSNLPVCITAVDAAQPRPDLIKGLEANERERLSRVRFLGGVLVEALPFEDQTFGLVTSQYGLEYCDLWPAGEQLFRVLRPGGELAVVTHAADSAMLATMQDELAGYRLLEQARLIRLLRSWARGQLAEPDFVRRAQAALSQLQRETGPIARSPLVRQVGQALAGLLQMPSEQRRAQRQAALTYANQLQAGQARLQDMLRVNRKIADDPAWSAPLECAGLVLQESMPLIYRGQHVMGQAMIWLRPA